MEYSDHARCPNCSSNMIYDIKAGALKCESCESVISISDYDDIVQRKKMNNVGYFSEGARVDTSDESFDAEDMNRTYICSSCDGRMTPGAAAATDFCPFCGNAIVFTDKYKSQRVPDMIVPFTMDRFDFIDKYQKECRQRLFVPEDFITEAKLENVKAWYIPFWLYDLTIEGSATYQVEDIGEGKNSYLHEIFEGVSEGRIEFHDIPQDGSKEVDDRISQRLEPFFIEDGVKFNFAYLSGLDAKIYNIDSINCMKRVESRTRETMDRYLSDAPNHDYYKVISRNYKMTPGKISYALMPIWNMDIVWKNEKFPFSMNGQTGRLVTRFPISWGQLFTCVGSSLWMLGCFMFWVISHDIFSDVDTGIKSMIAVSVFYGVAVCLFFPRLLFNSLKNTKIFGVLFFLIGCYLIFKSDGNPMGKALFRLSVFIDLVIITPMCILVLYEQVKEQNKIELRASGDTYISPDKYEDPTSLSFKQIKSVVTRNSTPIMRYGKEYHPD